MAEAVVERGWRVKALEGRCLFDQGPNPVSCALRGGAPSSRWLEINAAAGRALRAPHPCCSFFAAMHAAIHKPAVA
jgi:hypothetical protein